MAATTASQPSVRSHGGRSRRTGASSAPSAAIRRSWACGSAIGLVVSVDAAAQGLQRAVQVDLERAGAAAGARGGFLQRELLQAELLDRLTLARRQRVDRRTQAARLLVAFALGTGVVLVRMQRHRQLVTDLS